MLHILTPLQRTLRCRPIAANWRRFRAVALCNVLAGIVAVGLGVAAESRAETLTTPLEQVHYDRLSTSAEISAFLRELARLYPQARVELLGASVQRRPMEALLLTGDAHADLATPDRVTVLIVGSQHGTEGAGAESLLFIARDLLAGSLRPVLDDVDVVIVPNANPDGRDLGLRLNANLVNLNVDFVSVQQPESQALVAALKRYRPEVVLDVHESAILKKKSLALEGYMTDFTVQFEIANNPNIAPALRQFALGELLTPWIAAANADGLPANRYFAEIRSSRQPITNGGLTLNNLRNRAGIDGALSFLIETRQDPRHGDYDTFENIRARVQRQRTSIEHFLTLVHRRRVATLAALAAAEKQPDSRPLVLDAHYVPERGRPRVAINLRRIDDRTLQRVEFADHRTIAFRDTLPMPAGYLIRDHRAELRTLLDRHGIEYRVVDQPRTQWGVVFAAGPAAATPAATLAIVRQRVARVRARPGDLWIDASQARGRLAALILEPRSSSSLFLAPAYSQLIEPDSDLPIVRIAR